MKIGMQKRIYNAEIRNRRQALGLTQGQLAEKAGVSLQMVCAAECLRRGADRPDANVVMKLAVFFSVPPDVLCPDWLRLVTEAVPLVQDEQRDMTRRVLEGYVQRLDYERKEERPPDETGELKDIAEAALSKLDFREREILKAYLGIGCTPTRIETVARIFKISRGRTHQILCRAIRRMQNPVIARKFMAYVDPSFDHGAVNPIRDFYRRRRLNGQAE